MGLIEDRLKGILQFNLNRATRDAINWGSNRDKIEDMNKAQLLEGQNALGGDMPKYTSFTLRVKPAQFIPPNKSYSLKDSGKLHTLIRVDANLSSFTITSTDGKRNVKLQHQGPGKRVNENEAFGLTEANRGVMKDLILVPFIHRRLRGEI